MRLQGVVYVPQEDRAGGRARQKSGGRLGWEKSVVTWAIQRCCQMQNVFWSPCWHGCCWLSWWKWKYLQSLTFRLLFLQCLPLLPLEMCALSKAGDQSHTANEHRVFTCKSSTASARPFPLPTALVIPSLLLYAFWPKLWLLPAGLIIAWAVLQKSKWLSGQRSLRAISSLLYHEGNNFASAQSVAGCLGLVQAQGFTFRVFQ